MKPEDNEERKEGDVLLSKAEDGRQEAKITIARTQTGEKMTSLENRNNGRDVIGYAGKTAGRLASHVCSFRYLQKRIPIVKWAPNYNWRFLQGDIIAGITLALTVIPQGIGYAPLAGLPVQYGLYASLVPGFLYAVFGTVKEVTIGPTAVNSLMSYNYAGPRPEMAITLAFFTGLIEIFAGIFHLGFLIAYISAPVISAFTSAVSIQVATSQVRGLLGLRVPARGFVESWRVVFEHAHSIRPCDAALGFSCIGILLFLRKLKDFRWCEGPDPETGRARAVRKFKWFLSTSRNSIVILASALAAYCLVEAYNMRDVFVLTGHLEEGLPHMQLPWNFNVNSTIFNDPIEMASEFGIGLVLIPLVSVLQHMAITKFYTPVSGKLDASQEMVALGMCQFVGSFVGSLPVTASFGRSAINSGSGVRTPLGGCITGLIILAACAFLTPHFAYIPRSSLSALIISAVIFTVDVEIVLPLFRSKKADMVPFAITFFAGLFVSPALGLIFGSIAHLLLLLLSSGRPKIVIAKSMANDVPYVMVTPDRSLFYPSVEVIRSRLQASRDDVEANDGEERMAIVINLSNVSETDFTAARGLRAMGKMLKKTGQNVYFCCANEDVEKVLQGVDPALFISYSSLEEAEERVQFSSSSNSSAGE